MQDMIEAIRAAVAEDATAEQKASGAHACRTIAAALEADIGKPIALPGAPAPGPLAGIAPDQALDLLIARLRTVAEERDKQKEAATAEAPRNAEPSGIRIAFVQPPPRLASHPATRAAHLAAGRRAAVGGKAARKEEALTIAQGVAMLNNARHAEGRLARLSSTRRAQARARSGGRSGSPLRRPALHAGTDGVLGAAR